MSKQSGAALGLDFGTESVRALLVNLSGQELACAVAKYPHGQITDVLPTTGKKLPPDYALQHPQDWITACAKAVRQAFRQAKIKPDKIIGVGVDFTSCTMLPCLHDGTPLCLLKQFEKIPLAWPKLWKHHGAKNQTDRINQLARQRKEKFLDRYGGVIGLEWFFPKVLETLEQAPAVGEAAEVWLEAGDWFVWRLVGCDTKDPPRSTCQAGYKAMWSKQDGYPSRDFLAALHPKLAEVVESKMPGQLLAPGQRAGELCPEMAKQLGLPVGVPVSAAIIDAHAGVPGAGAAEPGALVMVLGTSSCHMLNALTDQQVPGAAGVVEDGILPGYFGYETGQAAVGDAFDWLRRTVGEKNFDRLTEQAAALAPGAEGVVCLDWFNGCRTPLMDGSLRGAFEGLTLGHGACHLYRALLEASAYGLRWIVELLREHKLPIDRLIATGGLPHHNPLLIQIYADVLNMSITIHPCKHGPALGAVILGALAAGEQASGFATISDAIQTMSGDKNPRIKKHMRVVKPDRKHIKLYNDAYQKYRRAAKRVIDNR